MAIIITHHDMDAEANTKKAASGAMLCDEPNAENDKIVRLIREAGYSLSMELALHRKKLIGAVDEDEWNAYQTCVLECIAKAKEETT